MKKGCTWNDRSLFKCLCLLPMHSGHLVLGWAVQGTEIGRNPRLVPQFAVPQLSARQVTAFSACLSCSCVVPVPCELAARRKRGHPNASQRPLIAT
jgi:hypothetical protein